MVDIEATSTDRTLDHDQVKSNYFILKEMPKSESESENQFRRPELFTRYISGEISFKLTIKTSLADETVFKNPRARDGNYCIPMHNSYILKS
ncbi:hypothetical protein [Aeromonas jandaei]|uniref:hypothetical protein n=1 Tax=Aeromonas jandaei TaxID=650 RepID=UPI001F2F89C2|nr:hypothetical protein [Aeromonas jandaei]